MQSLKRVIIGSPRGRGRERRGQGLANLGGQGADGGDRPDDHRPPRWSTPRRPRCRTVRAGGGSVGRPCRAASGRPTCGRRFGRCSAVALGASWTFVRRGICRVRGRLTAVSGFGKSPTAAVRDDYGPDAQALDRDMPASQRGGAAIDSFRPVDRDRGRRCPCSSSATAGAPSRVVWETRCTMVGRSWPDGPRVFDPVGRMHKRSRAGIELRETGLEIIGRRAGIVRGDPPH